MSVRAKPTKEELTTFEQELMPAIESLRGLACQLCNGNIPNADDLIGDVRLRALYYISSYNPGSNPKAWLNVMMRNIFYDRAKKEARRRLAPLDELSLADLSHQPQGGCTRLEHVNVDMDQLLDDSARIATVLEAIENIDSSFAQTIKIRYGMDDSDLPRGDDGLVLYRDIAEHRDVPMGTVMSHLHRGHRRVKAMCGVPS